VLFLLYYSFNKRNIRQITILFKVIFLNFFKFSFLIRSQSIDQRVAEGYIVVAEYALDVPDVRSACFDGI